MQIHNKTAKIGQNRPTFCVLCAKKGTGLKKKYTTAGYGGCDKYQVRACVLCNSHQKKRGCHSHFLCQGYKTVSPHLPWNVWGTGNPFRLGATALTFKWRWRSSCSGGGSPHVVGILMISLRGNKVGGRRWMRCGQNGRAGWSRVKASVILFLTATLEKLSSGSVRSSSCWRPWQFQVNYAAKSAGWY